ncbi:MAG: hypothetical protein MRZ64_06145, partial [[Bacteroides] pectinophilus]|nr:hypothetical protein [[Bacteroides] pectinophilus]
LAATKLAVRQTYGQNDSVTYIISIVNSGTAAINGLTITDNLGAYRFNALTLTPLTYIEGTVNYYVNGTAQPTPAVTPGPPLTVTGINVPAGGNVTVVYEAAVNEYAPIASGAELTNAAVITGGGITPITVSDTVEVETAPLLTITKSVSPVPVTENGTLTYTFLIQNMGNAPADAATGVVVTDSFDPLLSGLAVSFNGTAWTEAVNYTYDETTGSFTSNTGQITVPAATYEQDAATGAWVVSPGVSTLVISGTV